VFVTLRNPSKNAVFFNHGQSCVAGSRLFIRESIFDRVVSGVADLATGVLMPLWKA
jgi:acyl-CoA reductase-like NAD-dependent aldehyde dehydrogenase